jgi:phospholipase/carboxylesterase
MGQIGSWFAPHFPDALIVSVGGAEPCGPNGRQWFSVQGVTEESRQGRIDAIMPTFIETVRYWQQQSGVGANATALIGFSQGSIMSLESIVPLRHPGSLPAPASAYSHANAADKGEHK